MYIPHLAFNLSLQFVEKKKNDDVPNFPHSMPKLFRSTYRYSFDIVKCWHCIYY